MALDVKYLRGTQAQYDAYVAADKLVDTTYYLIYPNTVGTGTPVLYIGKVLLSESAEIVAVLAKANENAASISTMVDDIASIEEEIANLKENAGHKFYEVTELPEFIEGHNYKEGDVAIVTVTTDNVDYRTAYHCIIAENGNFAWAAMAGNYNASNVYYDKNIQVTKSVGNVTTSNNAPVDLQFKGKNMEQIWQYLYATEDTSLTVVQPSVSMSASGNVNVEVGNTFSNPTVKITFSDGNYEYGSKDSAGTKYTKDQGAGVLWSAATISAPDGSELASKTEASNSVLSTTYTIEDKTVNEGTVTYKFTGKASCPASVRKPITNLDNFVTSGGIATSNYADGVGATAAIVDKALSAQISVVGWRSCFYGYKAEGSLLDPTSLTSAQIRALSSPANALSSKTNWSTTKMQQMFFAAPKGKYNSVSVSNAVNGAPQSIKKITDVMVEGYNGYTATAYDVWYVNNDNADSGTSKYNVTIA